MLDLDNPTPHPGRRGPARVAATGRWVRVRRCGPRQGWTICGGRRVIPQPRTTRVLPASGALHGRDGTRDRRDRFWPLERLLP